MRSLSALRKEVRFLTQPDLIRMLPTFNLRDFLELPQHPRSPFSADFVPRLVRTSAEVAAAEI